MEARYGILACLLQHLLERIVHLEILRAHAMDEPRVSRVKHETEGFLVQDDCAYGPEGN